MHELIESALQSIEYPGHPEGLYEPIRYALDAGGKRLRPTLLLLAHGLYRSDPGEAVNAALAIEIYHNHTLLHDDLMDRADLRRGRPTVHRKWDDNTAVLSGDTMLIMAFRYILACPCRRRDELLSLFTRTMREVCEGQQYDVNFERSDDVTEAEYIEMIRLKTSVLLACAAKMGALVADAPAADADALYTFGERLGLAFQLQDDYLDVYGDPAVFGKKIGGDILCGKRTYLLIHALSAADAATRARLLALLGDTGLDGADKIAPVTAIYDRLGIPALTLAAVDRYFGEALAALGRLSSSAAAGADTLRDFAHSLMGRKK